MPFSVLLDVSPAAVIIRVIMGSEVETTRNKRASRRRGIDIALVLALAPVVAAAVRIWLYSGGDSSLFLTLLRTIDIPAILIGTSILIVPSLLIFIVFALVTDRKAWEWTKENVLGNRTVGTLVVPIILVVLGYTTPWPTIVLLVSVILVAVGIFFARRAWRKKHPKDDSKEGFWERFNPDSVPMLLSIVVMFLVTQSNMWLPLERMTIDQTPEVGYVLESTGEWTTILTSDRELTVTQTSDVAEREICESSNAGTLAMLIQGGRIKNAAECD